MEPPPGGGVQVLPLPHLPTMVTRDLVRDSVDCPTLANQSLCELHPAAMLNECR